MGFLIFNPKFSYLSLCLGWFYILYFTYSFYQTSLFKVAYLGLAPSKSFVYIEGISLAGIWKDD